MLVSKRGGGGGSNLRSLADRLRSESEYRSWSAGRLIARLASSIL